MRQSLCYFALIAGSACAGQIPVPLVDVDPEQLTGSNSISGTLPPADDSRGWAFQVRFPTLVTHLAWYDEGRDGLSYSHAVGIWRNTLDGVRPGTSWYWPVISVDELVIQTVIPAGTQAELHGPWRRLPITPILLQPGEYHIVGQNHAASTDNLVFWASRGHLGDPELIADGVRLAGMSYGQPEFGPVQPGHWLFWGDFPIPAALMGPMPFVIANIPEPSTSTMVLVGCFLLAGAVRKGDRSARAAELSLRAP
jgi:hypothetical protein